MLELIPSTAKALRVAALVALAPTVTSGCQAWWGAPGAQSGAKLVTRRVLDAEQTITVTAAVRVNQGRRLLQAVEAWREADIDHAKIYFYRGTATNAVEFRVPKQQLGAAVKFNNLIRNTSYRVEVRAWADAEETARIDNLDADAGSCTTSFATTNLAEMTLQDGLRLKLRDKVFAGQAAGAIGVTDGEVFDTTEPESISF
ncbi:MAG: hypothetical protein VKS61_03070 [Candidatus Sericytochromatia bacterium]|nr:hypothetical protein [Candidatus Sericytochromatia bacterium]